MLCDLAVLGWRISGLYRVGCGLNLAVSSAVDVLNGFGALRVADRVLGASADGAYYNNCRHEAWGQERFLNQNFRKSFYIFQRSFLQILINLLRCLCGMVSFS